MTTTYLWHPDTPVPPRLPVRQIYAWAVDDAGRVLVLDDCGRANLPGGTPEPADISLEATLHRELLEEADAVVEDVVFLGHQEVLPEDGAAFAQVRVAARLTGLRAQTPDPDNGRIYTRLLLGFDEAPARLGWGMPGQAQAAAAARVAREVYGIDTGPLTAHGANTASAPVTQVV